MTTRALGGFLQHLRKAMAAETLATLSDGALVERFLASHDEASFHALLRRHGPMVLRVCRTPSPRPAWNCSTSTKGPALRT